MTILTAEEVFVLAVRGEYTGALLDSHEELRAERDEWIANCNSWTISHAKWQEWARKLLLGHDTQPEGGEWGDGPARALIAGMVAERDAALARVAVLEGALRSAKEIAKDVAGKCEECGEPATGFSVETHPLNDGEPVVATTCDAHPVGDREEYPFTDAIRAINAALADAKPEVK